MLRSLVALPHGVVFLYRQSLNRTTCLGISADQIIKSSDGKLLLSSHLLHLSAANPRIPAISPIIRLGKAHGDGQGHHQLQHADIGLFAGTTNLSLNPTGSPRLVEQMTSSTSRVPEAMRQSSAGTDRDRKRCRGEARTVSDDGGVPMVHFNPLQRSEPSGLEPRRAFARIRTPPRPWQWLPNTSRLEALAFAPVHPSLLPAIPFSPSGHGREKAGTPRCFWSDNCETISAANILANNAPVASPRHSPIRSPHPLPRTYASCYRAHRTKSSQASQLQPRHATRPTAMIEPATASRS